MQKELQRAANKADQALESLLPKAPMIPKAARPKTTLDATAKKTDNALNGLRNYARGLEKGLPLTVQRVERARRRVDSTLKRIETIKVGGKARYLDETAYIRKLTGNAVKQMKAKNTDRANALLREAQAKMRGLATIVAYQRKLAAVGAPKELMDSVENAFFDYGRSTSNRAGFIIGSADFYIKHRDVFEKPNMKKTKDYLLKYGSALSKSARLGVKFDERTTRTARKIMDSIQHYVLVVKKGGRIETEKKIARTAMVSYTGRWADDAAAMRSFRFLHQKYRNALDQIHKDSKVLHRQLEKREGGAEAEYKKLEDRMKFTIVADRHIHSIENPNAIKGTSRIYGRGMDALKADDKKAAELQAFLAQEYARSGKRNRARLEKLSASLASKAITVEQVRKEAGAHLLNGLRFYLRRIPASLRSRIKTPLDAVKSALEGKTVSMKDLEQGRMAINLTQNLRSALGRINIRTRKDVEVRNGAFAIYKRAFSALQNGLPMEYLAAHSQLAAVFTRPRDFTTLHPEKGQDPASQKRKEIDDISRRFEQTSYLSQMDALIAKQKLTAMQAAQRVVGKGKAAQAMAKTYQGLGKNTKERSEEIKKRAQSLGFYIETTSARAELRRRRRKLRVGTSEELLYNTPIDFMDSVLEKIAKGGHPTEQEVKQVAAFRILHSGTNRDLVRLFSRNPQEMERSTVLFENVGNVQATIRTLRGNRRKTAIGMYANAQDAIINGKFNQLAVHMIGASAYASATNNEDMQDIRDIGNDVSNNKMTVDSGLWLTRTQLDRVNAESRIKNKAIRRNVRAYFDLSIASFSRNDASGAEAARNLANLYSSAVLRNQSDPQVQATIKWIYRVMGDHRRKANLTRHRFSHILLPKENKRSWQPPAEAVGGIVARALVSGKSLSAELGAAVATPADRNTAFGAVLSVDATRRVEALSIQSSRYEARMGFLEHQEKGMNVLGQTKMKQRQIQKVYSAQNKRHANLAERARAKKDATEADRQKTEANRINAKRMRDKVNSTNRLYTGSLRLFEEAAKLRMRALSEKGKTAKATIDEAAAKAQKGVRLMQLAESGLTALDRLHSSIMRVRTVQRESGRLNFERAADTYIAIGNEVLASEKIRTTPEQRIFLNQANSDMQMGEVKWARQVRFQLEVKQLLALIKQAEKSHKNNARRFGKGRKGGALTLSYTIQDKKGNLVALEGEALVNTRVRNQQFRRARSAAQAEMFPTARHYLRAAQRGNAIDTLRGTTQLMFQELLQGARLFEQQIGTFKPETVGDRRIGFDYTDLMRTLFRADKHNRFGRFAEVDALTSGYQTKLNFGYHTQRLLNTRNSQKSIVSSLDTMIDAVNKWGTIEADDLQRRKRADRSGTIAHIEGVKAIVATGGLAALAKSGKEIMQIAKKRVAELDDSLERIVEQGHADNMLGAENIDDIISAIHDATKGKVDIEKYEMLRDKVGDFGAFDEMMRFRPDDLIAAAEHLKKTNKINDAQASYMLALARVNSSQTNRRLKEYETGYQIALGVYNGALKRSGTVDQYERRHGSGNRIWHRALRRDIAEFLQVGIYAAQNPEEVGRAILEGKKVRLPAVNVHIRSQGNVYGRANLYAEARDATIPEALSRATQEYFEKVQIIGEGAAASVNENIGRLKKGQPIIWDHKESRALAEAYATLTLARNGYFKDPKTNKYVQVPNLSPEEQRLILEATHGREAGEGIDGLIEKYSNVALQLTSTFSEYARSSMYEAVGGHATNLNKQVAILLKRRLAGKGPATAEELGLVAKRIYRSRTDMQDKYEKFHMKGMGTESNVRIVTFVGETAGSAVLIFVTAGAASPYVGYYFGLKASYDLNEQARIAGGFSQMSTGEQVGSIGGIVVSLAGGALGGAGAYANQLHLLGRGASRFARIFSSGSRFSLWSGRVLLAGGLGMGVYGGVQSYNAWQAGDMGTAEFLTVGLLGGLQSILPLGQVAMPTRFATRMWTSRSLGARAFRGAMLILAGETRAAHETARTMQLREQHYNAYQNLTAEQRQVYHDVEIKLGWKMLPEDGLVAADAIARGMDAAETRLLVEAQPKMELLGKAYSQYKAQQDAQAKVRRLVKLRDEARTPKERKAIDRELASARKSETTVTEDLNQTTEQLSATEKKFFEEGGALRTDNAEEASLLINIYAVSEQQARITEVEVNRAKTTTFEDIQRIPDLKGKFNETEFNLLRAMYVEKPTELTFIDYLKETKPTRATVKPKAPYEVKKAPAEALTPQEVAATEKAKARIAALEAEPQMTREAPGIPEHLLRHSIEGDLEQFWVGLEAIRSDAKEKGVTLPEIRDKRPDGKPVRNVYDAIIANSEIFKGQLDWIRTKMPMAQPLFKAINSEISAGGRLAAEMRNPRPEWRAVLESSTLGVMVIDKAQTWLLNNLSLKSEAGDLGLFVFFKASDRMVAELRLEGVSVVKTGADDATIIISERGLKAIQERDPKIKTYEQAMKFIDGELKRHAKKIVDNLGLEAETRTSRAVNDYSTLSEVVTVSRDRSGKAVSFTIKRTGDALETFHEAVSFIESNGTKDKMTDRRAADVLTKLAESAIGQEPDLAAPLRVQETTTPRVYQEEAGALHRIDDVVTIRFQYGETTNNALLKMTETKGKAQTAVRNGDVGPSAINPIGSSVTDAFSRFYQAALEQSFAEFGIKVTLYETGPMSFGIAFPEGTTPGLKKQMLQRANEIFIEKMPSDLDVKGVSAYHTDTVEQGRLFTSEELFGAALTPEIDANGRRLVALLHTNPEAVVKALKKAGVDDATVSAVRSVNGVKWMRETHDIRAALAAKGATPNGINLLFEISGLPYRKAERGRGVSRKAKDLVRLETGDPKNPLRRIPTAEEDYLVARLRGDEAYQKAKADGDTDRMHLIAEQFTETKVPPKIRKQAQELAKAFKRGYNEKTDSADLQLYFKEISRLKNENPGWTDYRASLEIFHRLREGLFKEPLRVRKEASDLLAIAEGRPLVERKAATTEQSAFAKAMLDDPRFKAAKTDGERYKIATEYASVFLNTSPTERALIVKLLAKGSRLDNAVRGAFYDAYRIESNRPSSSEEYLSLASRLDNLSPSLRRKALSRIEDAASKRVYDVLDQLLLHADNPQKQKIIMQEWQRAKDVAEAQKLTNEVIRERERNPEAVRKEELGFLKSSAVKKQLGEAGIKPGEVAKAYDQAYNQEAPTDLARLDNARKAVLDKLGVKLGEKVTRPEEVFDLILKGGLSERIRSTEGFEGAQITNVEGLGGARGAYRIDLQVGKQKRSLLLKLEDGQPADFGAQRAAGEGMVAPRIYETMEFATGLRDPRTGKPVTDPATGEPIKQKYYLMEDVHDYAPGPKEQIVLGKRKSGTVEVDVVGEASAKGREVDVDLIIPGEKPGTLKVVAAGTVGKDGRRATVRSVSLFGDATRFRDTNNAAALEMWRLMGTPEGRQKVFQALHAYYERSRRALMFDRRPPNTAIFLVEYEGEYHLTFQPIDTDGVGNRIGMRTETRQPNFNYFYADFWEVANRRFLDIFDLRSPQAVGNGLLDASFSYADLVRAASSATARAGANLPINPARVSANATRFATYDGYMGNGYHAFDAAHVGFAHGTYADFGGEKRMIARADGRIKNNGPQMERVYRVANTHAQQKLFANYSRKMLQSYHADYLAGLAGKVDIGTLMPEQLGGYKDYVESARTRIARGEEAKTVYRDESNRMLKGQPPGMKEALKAAAGE